MTRPARRKLNRRTLLAGALGLSLSGLASCLPSLTEEETTPTAAVSPIESPLPPQPTATTILTATPEPATATRAPASPSPVGTSENRPTATPDLTPTPTATTASYRSPLTGLTYSTAPRKPLAVQIDNAPDARPQTGLGMADIVYEAPTEVGTTRYTAFFGSTLPATIGPVRSVRMIALEVIPPHDGILVYSGGSIDMLSALLNREIPALLTGGNAATASWRDSDRSSPHNLYVSGPELAEITSDLEIGGRSDAESFSFGPPPNGGEPSSGVTIPFTAGEVEYVYDPRLERYRRSLAGEPHRDLVTDRQILADNVVLLYATFAFVDITEDEAGERTLGVMLTGEGKAGLLRDGRWYDAVWRREREAGPFRFYNALTDEELPLRMGTTWFAVIPQWLREVSRHP